MSTKDAVLSIVSAGAGLISGVFGAWASTQRDGLGAAMVLMFLAGCFMGILMMLCGRSAAVPEKGGK